MSSRRQRKHPLNVEGLTPGAGNGRYNSDAEFSGGR
jgi:hypothetical protein